MKAGARFVFVAGVAAISGGAATAQSGGGYDLHWNTPAAGGRAMAGNAYTMTGTVGQAAASASACGASGYAVRSGLWAGIPEGDVIFRNGFDPGC